jgi:hypothetical protein
MAIKLRATFSGLCAFVCTGKDKELPNEVRALLINAGEVEGCRLPAHTPRLVVETRFTTSEPDEVVATPDGKEYAVWNLSGDSRFVVEPAKDAPALDFAWRKRTKGITGNWVKKMPDPDNAIVGDPATDASWVAETHRLEDKGPVAPEMWGGSLPALLAARLVISMGKLEAAWSDPAVPTTIWEFHEWNDNSKLTYEQALADQMQLTIDVTGGADRISLVMPGRMAVFSKDSNGNSPVIAISNMPVASHAPHHGATPDPWVHHFAAYYELTQAYQHNTHIRRHLPYNPKGGIVGGRRIFCPVIQATNDYELPP